MKITKNTKGTHYSVGLNTLGGITLLLIWAVITSHLSPWWLILAIPTALTSIGFEIQEKSPRITL